MAKKIYIHLKNGQTSILDDPRPIAEAVKDTERYQITSIISRGIEWMDKIRESEHRTKLFLEDARRFHPTYVAWRHGMLPSQARALIRELENQLEQ